MASAAQTAANRCNALKSTGPRTARGKAVVSRNALKHGLRSQATLLPREDADQFLALVALFRAEHQPADSLQEACVLQMASAVWRVNRADQLETETVAQLAQAPNDIIAAICKIDVLIRYRTT